MGDRLREHALHLLATADGDSITEIIRMLERGGIRRPASSLGTFNEVFSRSFISGISNDGTPAGNSYQQSPATTAHHRSPTLGAEDSHLHIALCINDPDGGQLQGDGAASPGTMEPMSPLPPSAAATGGRRAAVSDAPSLISTNAIQEYVPPVIDKDPEDVPELRRQVAACHLFTSLDTDEQEVVVKAMDKQEFSAGTDILRQGFESANRFYVIISGTVSIIKSGKQVATIGAGQSFGELEMMYDTQEPCAATVHAVTDVVTYFLDRLTFKSIVLKATMEKRKIYLQMLKAVEFLRGMSDYDMATLADCLQRADFQPDEPIIRFGEKGTFMHIIVSGEVKVVGREMGKKVEIVRLGPGNPVGELEFLFSHAAVADVLAVNKVRTAKMSRKHFEMTMGPIANNLKLYLKQGNYEHYLKNADKAVLGEISAAEQKLKRTKVSGAGGNVIASGSVDRHGEIVVLDDHTQVDSAGSPIRGGGHGDGGHGGDKDDEQQQRNKFMYRFPLVAVHQQNSVIIGCREDGVILSWNHAAARLTNYSAEDTLGQSIFSLIKRSEDQAQLHKLLEDTVRWAGNTDAFFAQFEDGRLPHTRVVFSRRDGLTHTNVSMTCVPGVVAQKGIPEMLLLVGSEQKRLPPEKENDFSDWLVEQLRKLELEKSDGSGGGVSKGQQIESLLKEFELLRSRSSAIDRDQLHSVNPRQLIGQVVSSLQHDAVERDNTVTTHFSSRLPPQLFCDTELLPDVCRVALHNCITHVKNAKVVLRVDIVDDRGIEYLEITFEDNGPNGIDPGQLAAFHKTKAPSQYASTSLIKLKAAVAKMGGIMQVESVPGHTVVKIRVQYLEAEGDEDAGAMMGSPNVAGAAASMLPSTVNMDGGAGATMNMAGGAAGDSEHPGSPHSAAAKNRTYTTLVAEEHAVSRNALCSLLWNRKHAVVPAHTAEDFMRLVEVCDIIVVDPEQRFLDVDIVSSKGGSVFDFLQRLERRKAVVLAGQNFTEEVKDAHRKAGFITLSKPYSPVQTIAAIRHAEQTVGRIKLEQEKVEALRETFSKTNRSQWTKGALLGKGAFGDVYEAVDTLTGGKMAVKMMRINKHQSKNDLIAEIDVMTTLHHPNIIHYFYAEDVAEDLRVNIFMEYAGGGTLSGKLAKLKRPMTAAEMRPILVDIIEGVRYVHGRRFVHCDLKTDNVLFSGEGRAKLGDFGTARQLTTEGAKLYNMSGTIMYMSPECMSADAEEKKGYDFASDIWSIGCIAMELATGKAPWSHLGPKGTGFGLVNYITSISEEQHTPDLAFLFDAVDPAIFEFVSTCLALQPDKRPTAAQLLDYPLLRNSGSDDSDMASALKALKKAKLIHTLNQFVAFVDPMPEEGPDSARAKRQQSQADDAQRKALQREKEQSALGAQVVNGAGWGDSDEEEDAAETGKKSAASSKRSNNSVQSVVKGAAKEVSEAGGMTSSQRRKSLVDKAAWDSGDDLPTPKQASGFFDSDEEDGGASPKDAAKKAAAAGISSPTTAPPTEAASKQQKQSPDRDGDDGKKKNLVCKKQEVTPDKNTGNDNKNNRGKAAAGGFFDSDEEDADLSPSAAAKKAAANAIKHSDASGACPPGHSTTQVLSGNSSTLLPSPSSADAGPPPGAPRPPDCSPPRRIISEPAAAQVSTDASGLAVHDKLMQLLAKISEVTNLPSGAVVDPLQLQYKASLPDEKKMGSSTFGDEKSVPFVPRVGELLQSHAAQLEKILHLLEAKTGTSSSAAASGESAGRNRTQL